MPDQPPASAGSAKIWRVGTLAYTTGGLVVLFCWLLWGDFAFALRARSIPPVVQLLFKRFGASDMLTGLLFSSLPSAIGLVLGPVVGYNLDRFRSRWGRRIPFLIVPTPFIVLSMIGLGFSPQLGHALHHLLGPALGNPARCILILMGLFWMIFEISCITGDAVFAALINDVVPAPVVGRFYGMFRALSLIAGILFNYSLMGQAETRFLWIFLGMGALYGAGFTIMCLKVKEGNYPPPPPAPAEGGFLAGMRSYFKDGFGNPYYLWYFAAIILIVLPSAPFNLYAVFYAKSLGMNLDLYGKCLALTYAVSLVLAYPLGALADRFHPLRVTIALLLVYAGIAAWGALYAKDVHTFSIALIVHGIVSGSLFTASASLAQRLLPRARFAEISSAGGIINSLVWMVLAPVMGTCLDLVHHVYRYTFHAGFFLVLLALVANCVLHAKFMALGGPRNYVAPE